MLIAAALGLALVVGVPWSLIGIAALWAIDPRLGVLAVAITVARSLLQGRRRPGPDEEARFLRDLGTELIAGASMRSALVAAARATELEVDAAAAASLAGLSADRVAPLLEEALPVNGRLAGAAWSLSARSGSPAAPVMRRLALRAARVGEMLRERRASTAQARASAWLVAGLPLALVALSLASGRLSGGSDPVLLVIIALGVGLQAAGVAVVAWMVRAAGR